MTDRSPDIMLFCAHRWEAAPFIERLRLKESTQPGFAPVYLDKLGRYALYLTGQGPQRAAAVVAGALASPAPDPSRVLGSFGTAGAPEGRFEVGRAFLVHRVRDSVSRRSFYPDRLVRSDWREAACTTLHIVGQHCDQGDTLYDMELSGVLTAAELFLSSAQIVAGKLISDHIGETPPDWQQMVEAISTPYRQACFDFLDILEAQHRLLSENTRTKAGMTADRRVNAALAEFTPHFTVTQCRRLENVLKSILLSAVEDSEWKRALENAHRLLASSQLKSKKDRTRLFDKLLETLQASNLFSVQRGKR